MLRFAGLPIVFALALAPAQEKSEVDRVLDAWEARVKSLTSFTCRFEQEKKVSFMRRPLVSTGTMTYRDRKLLWKTETPAPGFLSVDANEVRIYTPEFKTLEIYPLQSNTGGAGGTAGAFGGAFPGVTGDLSKLRETYSAKLLSNDEQGARLEFAPKTDELKKQVVSIEVTLDRASLVKAWRIVRTNGDELSLSIRDFVPDAEVKDADLVFEVPPDTKIVRPAASPKRDGGPK